MRGTRDEGQRRQGATHLVTRPSSIKAWLICVLSSGSRVAIV